MNIPSATLVRKTGATNLARSVSGPIATWVQNQMAHLTKTLARFYRAITGAKDAAVAFHSMERLRQQEKPGVVARAKKPFPSSTEGETVGNLCEIGPEIVRINHPEDQSRIEAPG